MLKGSNEKSASRIPEANRRQALTLAGRRWHANAGAAPRNFLNLGDVSRDELLSLVDAGLSAKRSERVPTQYPGRGGVLLFQKTSTRTRCSFEAALRDLGMQSSFVSWAQSNFTLAAIEDEVRVLSRYYDVIIARVNAHQTLLDLAATAEVPVINGLSDFSHPCQVLSDLVTIKEFFGQIEGIRLAYVGDGNNMCRSLLEAATIVGFDISICTPADYALPAEELTAAKGVAELFTNPRDAVVGADIIYTDTWVSMGQEAETARRLEAFRGFEVNEAVVAAAPAHALIMHCLPAHPGVEISAETLRSKRSIVFDQAENRRHAQRALLEHLL
jgi:ornithine carbamoyltransferase